MSSMASQIAGVSIVYSTPCSGADQRKHQSSASLTFVRGIHRWPVNSQHKRPVTRKCFHLMTSSCFIWLWGIHNIVYVTETLKTIKMAARDELKQKSLGIWNFYLSFIDSSFIFFSAPLHWCEFSTLRPGQNGRHFPDDIFEGTLLNENV